MSCRGTGSFGYLLKDRVLRVDEFVEVVERVGGGGSALDPSVVAALVAPRRREDRLGSLSAREVEVLGLVAEGLTNLGVASRLCVADRTVEAHMRSIFQKLGILTQATTTAGCSPWSRTSTDDPFEPAPPLGSHGRSRMTAIDSLTWVRAIEPMLPLVATIRRGDTARRC
jgi:DNA-binding CsgD family transcriptional regulator